jgi:type I restriction enzyme, S subunit
MKNKITWLRFEEIFELPLRNGLFRPTALRGSGIKMVNMGELFSNSIIENIPMEKVELSTSEMEKYVLEPGDLLFARSSLVLSGAGKCAIFQEPSEPTTFESHIIRARLNKSIAESWFYYYFFNSSTGRRSIESIVEQVAAAGIRASDLAKILVPYPPLLEQKAAAFILKAFDYKASLNRYKNQTLEQIVQVIFKSWFIDFEFPNEQGKPYKSSGGEMVDSELGSIPQGWRVSEIGREIKVSGGSTPSTSERAYWENGKHHWATPKDLSKLDFFMLLSTERKITDEGLKVIGSRKYPEGVLLMSSRAPIGYLGLSKVSTAVNQGIIAMVCDSHISNYYMLNWCRANLKEILNRANGTTFLEISKSAFRSMKIIVPSLRQLDAFKVHANALYSAITEYVKQSETLANMRDILIPKLLSGALSTKDAQHEKW